MVETEVKLKHSFHVVFQMMLLCFVMLLLLITIETIVVTSQCTGDEQETLQQCVNKAKGSIVVPFPLNLILHE